MRGNLTTKQAFLQSFNTNVVSTHSFTASLIPLLLESSSPQIVFLSSGISSLGEHGDDKYPVNKSPEEKGWPKKWSFNSTTYRTSKTAANMMALEWKRGNLPLPPLPLFSLFSDLLFIFIAVLKPDGVKIHLIDPGFLATTLGDNDPLQLSKMGAKDPMEGAKLVREVVEGRRDADEGRVVMEGGVVAW